MKRTVRWTVTVALAALCVALLIVYSGNLLQMLQPGFLVVEIRAAEKTMVLQWANHRYVVRCDERCGDFKPGRRYPMKSRGGILVYHWKEQRIELPVLEEQIFFETRPGGLG